MKLKMILIFTVVFISMLIVNEPAKAVNSRLPHTIYTIEPTFSLGDAQVEGDNIAIAKMKIAFHWRLFFRFLSIGPTFSIYESHGKVDLFDKIVGGEFGVDFVGHKKYGDLITFFKIHMIPFSGFDAIGNIRRTITNGTVNDEGYVIFPGFNVPSSHRKIDTYSYKLTGISPGTDISFGAKYKIAKNFKFMGELGYSFKYLVVYSTDWSSRKASNRAEYSFDKRRGIDIIGSTEGDDQKVQANRDVMYFPSLFISLGISYNF